MYLNKLKRKIKKCKKIKNFYFLLKPLFQFFVFKPVLCLKQYKYFFKTYYNFKKVKNPNFKKVEFYPCLFDNISYTPVDPVYFYQDTWFAEKIFKLKPKFHVDVGSSLKTIGIISQYVPTVMVDIRPPRVKLPKLYFIKANILQLPFKDNSLECVSSLCVIEHIGLGRYGDRIDPFGSEKAIDELKRVIKVGGVLIISVPIDSENKVYFNAHRTFTREYILGLFGNTFLLVEERYQYGYKIFHSYDPRKGFGTGFYMFRRLK